MKRSLILCLTAALTCGSTALAGNRAGDDDLESVCASQAISRSRTGFLGVEADDVTGESASRLRLSQERGALITRVINDTSAAKAGLQKDDVIVGWNAKPVDSAAELSRQIHETPAGRAVRLKVIRGGSEVNLDLTLGESPEYTRERALERAQERIERARERAERQTQERAERARERSEEMAERVRERAELATRVRLSDWSRLGVQLQTMSAQLAEYFGLSGRNGSLVVFVHSDSAAAKAGIRAGDVIISVASQKTEYPRDVIRALSSRAEGPVEITVMRDKKERSVTVQLEKDNTTSWVAWPVDFEVLVPLERLVVPVTRVSLKAPRIVTTLPRVTLSAIATTTLVPARKLAPVVIPRIAMPKIVVPSVAPSVVTLPPIRVPMKIRRVPRVL